MAPAFEPFVCAGSPVKCPGVLPESSSESVLEDLISADRYRLLGMKRVCQSMLRLSADTCLQVRFCHVDAYIQLRLSGTRFFRSESIPPFRACACAVGNNPSDVGMMGLGVIMAVVSRGDGQPNSPSAPCFPAPTPTPSPTVECVPSSLFGNIDQRQTRLCRRRRWSARRCCGKQRCSTPSTICPTFPSKKSFATSSRGCRA